MKKVFSKIKANLVAFRIALISFPLKVKGLESWEWKDHYAQPDYGIYYPSEKILQGPSSTERTMMIIEKITPRLLITVTFIVGIVSFIKIRKIEDETLKKKKIRNAVIIISILVILIIALIISSILLTRHI